MFAQRMPSDSMTSTCELSGSATAGETTVRPRDTRAKRGLGRLGMGTSRLVAHRVSRLGRLVCHAGIVSGIGGDAATDARDIACASGAWVYCPAHSSTHRERWRDWPCETAA